jgi:hypothetical protein
MKSRRARCTPRVQYSRRNGGGQFKRKGTIERSGLSPKTEGLSSKAQGRHSKDDASRITAAN